MKIDANEFMKTHPVRKRASILEPFKDEILKLKRAGYSIRQIVEFLELNNVTISSNALNSFVKTRQKIEPQKGKWDRGSTTKADSSSKSNSETLASKSVDLQARSVDTPEKKRELFQINGRVIDVNYKPSWVDEDINLKDLL